MLCPETALTFWLPFNWDAQTWNAIIRLWADTKSFYFTVPHPGCYAALGAKAWPPKTFVSTLTHLEKCLFLLSILQPFLKAACFHSSLNNCHHLFNPVRPAADRISWCLLLVSRYCNPRPPSSSFSPQTLKLQWLHLSRWARGWRKEAINGTEFCCILAILCVKITNSSV